MFTRTYYKKNKRCALSTVAPLTVYCGLEQCKCHFALNEPAPVVSSSGCLSSLPTNSNTAICFLKLKNDPFISSSPLCPQSERRPGWWGSIGRSTMAVRRLVSGRSGSSMRYVFHPLFGSISTFSRFICIGFFCLFFFFIFHPSSPSIDALSGLGVGNSLHFELIVCFLPFDWCSVFFHFSRILLGIRLLEVGVLGFGHLWVLGTGFWV